MFWSFRGYIHFIVERTGWGEKPVMVHLQDPVSADRSPGGPARVLRAPRGASLELISTMISKEGALSQPESQLMRCGCLHVYLLPAFNSTSRSSTCTSAGEGASHQQGALCAQREPPLLAGFPGLPQGYGLGFFNSCSLIQRRYGLLLSLVWC